MTPPQENPKTPDQERQAARAAARRDKAVARRRGRGRERIRAAQRRAASPAPEAPPAQSSQGRPKIRQGVVTSDKADKTITVRIDIARRHRRYQKIVRHTATLHVHDESNDAHEGDTVRVVECRPLSATKRWRLTDVVEKAR